MPKLKKMLTVLAATALLLAGCAVPEPVDNNKLDDLPETAWGQQVTWVIGILNAEEPVTAEQLIERFSDEAVAQAGEESFVQVADFLNYQVRPLSPFRVLSYVDSGSTGYAVLSNQGSPIAVTVNVDPSGALLGLFFGQPPAERVPAETLEELVDRLEKLDAEVSISVDEIIPPAALAESEDGADEAEDQNGSASDEDEEYQLETVFAMNPKQAMPAASASKLYILSALAKAIIEERITWEQELVITAESKSLPSGELQNLPDDSIVTVREAAQKLIELSDNTAADLLLATLGRDAVEQTVQENRAATVSGMVPFLSTKELFELAWGDQKDLAKQWSTGNASSKRAVLEELAHQPFTVELTDLSNDPVWTGGFDWFTSANDLNRIHRTLQRQALEVPELREILAANPGQGLDFGSGKWSYIGFKGGSSIGVVTLSWFAETVDGRMFTISIMAADTEAQRFAAEVQPELFALVEDLFRLL